MAIEQTYWRILAKLVVLELSRKSTEVKFVTEVLPRCLEHQILDLLVVDCLRRVLVVVMADWQVLWLPH